MSLTSNGLFNPMNRFGFTKAQLLAYSEHYKDRSKVECYIPTRNDVFKMPMQELMPVLQQWFTRAPPALVPSEQQKRTVVSLLKLRPDRDAIAADISALEGILR